MNTKQTIGRQARRVSEVINQHPAAVRCVLAGPGALLAGIATMMAMPVWLPAGAAGINDIAFPVLLTPLLWAVPFFYAVLEANLVRGALVILGAVLVQGALIVAKVA